MQSFLIMFMAWMLLVLVVTLMASPVLAEEELAWWMTAIFYQIYPRSFKDSDGDGIGDLEGIRSKLDYIKNLGVDAVWLSPIYKSPMADFGYDIADFRDIATEYGTLVEFDKLVKEAHEKGLKLVMDFVPNHSSDEHEWYVKGSNPSDPEYSKYKDYYVWQDGKDGGRVPPNNWNSLFGVGKYGDAWTKNSKVGQFYLHQFDKKQPDLNYRNPILVQEMKDVIKFWLDRGVDGFRVDAIAHLFEDKNFTDNPSKSNIMVSNLPETYDMVAQWREILDTYPDKVMMVEVYSSVNKTMEYFGTESKPAAHFPFNFFIISKVNKGNLNAKLLVQTIYKWVDNVPKIGWNNWVVGNHDTHRVASRLGPENVDFMNMLVQLLPGSAITYNGEELGMENNWDITYEEGKDPPGCIAGKNKYAARTRDFERSPFQWDNSTNAGFSTGKPWLPVNKDYKTVNVVEESQVANSHLNLYKSLAQLRKQPVIQRGIFGTNYVGQNVFTFVRELDTGEVVVVVVNLGEIDEVVDLIAGLVLEVQTLPVYVSNAAFKTSPGDVVTLKSVLVPSKGSAVLSNLKIDTLTLKFVLVPSKGSAVLTNLNVLLALTISCYALIGQLSQL